MQNYLEKVVLQRGFEPRMSPHTAASALDPLRSKNASRFGVRGFDKHGVSARGDWLFPLAIIECSGSLLCAAEHQKSSLAAAFLVLQRGFEPRTPCLKGRCSAY